LACSRLHLGARSAVSAHSSPNGSFLSGALDSADSVRFSKFECFETLLKSNELGFCCSSRTGKSIDIKNRHIERFESSHPSQLFLRSSGSPREPGAQGGRAFKRKTFTAVSSRATGVTGRARAVKNHRRFGWSNCRSPPAPVKSNGHSGEAETHKDRRLTTNRLSCRLVT
jgi:hypothetical protein